MILRSILCATDFSEQSRHALRRAGELAAQFRSRLTVLTVVDPLLAEAARMRLGQDLARDETEPALREFVSGTWPNDARGSETIVKVMTGNAADVILKAAVAEGADLIVIGTQGLGGFRKWILGSVTERVLRGTQIAVLAVPPPGEGRGSGAADVAIGSGPLAVATDFSESSSAAVKQAALFARHFAVPLVLVHIVEAVTAPAQWRALGEQSDERRITDARGRLRRMADQLPNSRDYESVVAVGRPAPLIGSIAEERGATLIVMGLTGEQGAFAPRPGSIAYRVLCATTIPVLVVPPAKTGSR